MKNETRNFAQSLENTGFAAIVDNVETVDEKDALLITHRRFACKDHEK